MQLTASGIGSGLDIGGLVDQLVAAERLPVSNRLNLREARANAELSALGQLKSALADFQSALGKLTNKADFQGRIATSGREDLFTVSAANSASPGRFSLEVISLAAAHKLASAAFSDAGTEVGYGTLTISVGAVSADIEIAQEANSLDAIRDAINAAPDNPGVDATIIVAEDGAHLVLTSRQTGAAAQITVSETGGDGGLDSLTYDPAPGGDQLTEIDAARDAEIALDGFQIFSASNTVTGAIGGVTIDLLGAAPGESEDFEVDFDETGAVAAVGDFVAAYNALIDTIAELTSFDPETLQAGTLLGDITVRNTQQSLRRVLGDFVDDPLSPFRTLADVGVTTETDGRLALSDDDLNEAIAADFDAVGELLAGTGGFAIRLDAVVSGVMDSSSLLLSRESSLRDRLDDIETDREALDIRMEQVRRRYQIQFEAMDRLVAQLQNTSSFLLQQLGSG